MEDQMFKLSAKIILAIATVATAGLVAVGNALAWSGAYGAVGTYGEFHQPQLSHYCYANRLTIGVMNPDVGARAEPDIINPDGSHTVGIGSGGDEEPVWYQATLYRQTSSGWLQVGQGDWWTRVTGPWSPNVLITYNWYNATRQRWDDDLVVGPDVLGASYRQTGGLTMFANLPIAQYAMVMDYRWAARYDANRNLVYNSARALQWQGNISC